MRHMTLASLVLLEGPPISSHSGTSTVYSRPWLILIITENFTVTFGIFHRNKAKMFLCTSCSGISGTYKTKLGLLSA